MENEVETLQALVKWPTSHEEVSVDLILRIVGAEAQRTYLRKWASIDKEGKAYFDSPLYRTQVEMLLSSLGFMATMHRLKAINPDAALEMAVWYWEQCEGGDSIGEFLWDYTEKAGLDPELIKLPEVAHAD